MTDDEMFDKKIAGLLYKIWNLENEKSAILKEKRGEVLLEIGASVYSRFKSRFLKKIEERQKLESIAKEFTN